MGGEEKGGWSPEYCWNHAFSTQGNALVDIGKALKKVKICSLIEKGRA